MTAAELAQRPRSADMSSDSSGGSRHSTLLDSSGQVSSTSARDDRQQRPERKQPTRGDLEKGHDNHQADAEEVRDEDGVKVEEGGIPLVRLTPGGNDPYSQVSTEHETVQKVADCMVALSYPGTREEFGLSEEVVTLGLSLFIFGLGSFPLLVGPMSEFYGRRPIYNLSFFFFICFNILVAFSPNPSAYFLGRFLSGASGAAFLSVAGGSVSDVFPPNEVATPMAVYTSSTLVGPALGPLLSGFINQHLNWRWTWYILTMWAAVEAVLLFGLVPETFLPARLKQKAKKLRKRGRTDVKAPIEVDDRSIPKVVAMSCVRPFQILVAEPMALALCTWTALLLGILYAFFSGFNFVYTEYGFEPQFVGMSFIGIGLGVIIGTLMTPFWNRFYRKVEQETGHRPGPEEHLRKGMAAAVIIPASLFWFAWTTLPSVHWIVSEIASVFFGIGSIWAFQATFTYLVDAFRPVAASAMSANSVMRSTFGGVFPLFTSQMFRGLGNQWAITLCAFLCLAMTPWPFLFYFYGARFRKNSRFANTD
ncbi:hypothetical protein OIO90_001255 [Microbotryomycetes sp. JL221]|nr:hypothetical protein OIO90_001255 [Microbotryomycetes sp. JL221]